MPAYGKIKINTLTYDSSGSAVDLAVSDIAPKGSPTFTGTINGATAVLTGNLTVDTNTLHVDATNNRVGIGTVSPVAPLQVQSASEVAIALDGWNAIGGGTANNVKIGGLSSSQFTRLDFYTGGSERLRVGSAGQVGIAGANYGSSGQVLTSGGASAAPSWTTVAGGVSSDAQQNTVGGTNAGDSFTGTDANDNTLFGYNAGTAITSGDNNVCIGSGAGESLTTSGDCTIIGYQAATDLTTAWIGCTVIGQRAGYKLTGTGGDVIIGRSAGYNQTSGGTDNANTFIGTYAGYSTTTGNKNTYIGRGAGYSNQTSIQNTFIGWNAGYTCSREENSAIGFESMQYTNGLKNVFFGLRAGKGASSRTGGLCQDNTGVGSYALAALNGGSGNTCFGYSAGGSITTGGDNTLIGKDLGGVTTGTKNLFLGVDAGSGNSPSGNITTGSNNVVLGGNSITNLYCADTSISSSDQRDKTDIANFTYGLSWINKLNPITYRWDKRTWYNEYNEDGSLKTEGTPDGSKKPAKQHIGFLAQDVLAIEQADGFAGKKDDMLVVNLNEDDTAYGLKYERLVPVLVNAVKELSAKVETLETKVAALEAA